MNTAYKACFVGQWKFVALGRRRTPYKTITVQQFLTKRRIVCTDHGSHNPVLSRVFRGLLIIPKTKIEEERTAVRASRHN